MSPDHRLRNPWRRDPEMASCREVGRHLQAFLDGEADDLTVRRIERHLEACRRCGLEARTYAEIKRALLRRDEGIDHLTVARLKNFGERLARAGPEGLGSEAAPPGT